MANIVDIINNLPELLPMKAATVTEITDAELQLRISFSDEYKEYLLAFGAIIADGIELSGIAKSEHRNVVALTKQEWELNSKVPHNMYVVENTCVDGIIIWQDSDGLVYQTNPNSDPTKIANSLKDYIVSRTDD